MPKLRRIKRPTEELKQEFVEQLQLLRNACISYDNGFEAIGKHIALSLRVLLHNHGQSHALMHQLGIREIKFYDSAGPLNPKNILSECNLVALRASNVDSNIQAKYIPMIQVGIFNRPMNTIEFVDWWNTPVLKDTRGRTFCRRRLILSVTNTDGGAHVDPELDAEYMAISRENSLGWIFRTGDQLSALKGRPELGCMRQIAHELLSTIHNFIPEFSQHAKPIIPNAEN